MFAVFQRFKMKKSHSLWICETKFNVLQISCRSKGENTLTYNVSAKHYIVY